MQTIGKFTFHTQMLFEFKGTVVQGMQNGRKIGFPTANVEVDLTEPEGTYVAEGMLADDAKPTPGILFIGKSATVVSEKRTYELNMFRDFEGREFYGEQLAVRVYAKLRENRRFNGLEDLKQQLAKDRETAVAFFSQQRTE